MIVFNLECGNTHRFEGWFRSTQDFEKQVETGLLRCPHCDTPDILKAPMAPAVSAKGNRAPAAPAAKPVANTPVPPPVAAALRALAEVQARTLPQSEWVGDRFAERVRSMHYGEAEEKLVHGRASAEDAVELLEEGIAVAPLLVPVSPPDEIN